MKTHENPSSKFNISLYSPSSNVEERNRMEENEDDLGEEMDNGDNSEIINWSMRKEICRILYPGWI